MTMFRRLLVALALLLAVTPVWAADSYTGSPELRARALEGLFARAGETRPIMRLTFRPAEISLVVQADSGDNLAEWLVQRIDLQLVAFNNFIGPRAHSDFSVVDDPKGGLFRFHEIRDVSVDAVVANAVAYAKLEDAPLVDSIEIARSISIVPEPAYGDLRWTVVLTTERERAIVYADARGHVIGGDLSGTIRAETLELLASDDWPMEDAQTLLGRVIGTARVHTVRIYDSYVFVTADHPTDSGLQRDYSWNLEGVTRGIIDTPNLVTLGMGGIATFPFAEIDLTKLPAIKAAAVAAFDAPGSVIVGIDAEMPTDRVAGELRVLWDVELKQSNGETGHVLVDTEAKVVEVHLPESRLPAPGPWLAPATIADTLARIEKAFGPDAKIFELSINDRQASLQIEDPMAPGQLAQFLVDAREIQRFGSASYFADLAPDHVFTMRDLTPLTVERLTELAERTLARIGMADAEVYRYTMSRQALIMDPSDTRLMVEIRAGKDFGNVGGWVTYLLDGTETDVLLP